MLPEEIVVELIENELHPASLWAERKNLNLVWEREILQIKIILVQPETNENFFLTGELDNYRTIPPAWMFRNSNWQGGTNKPDYPARPKKTPWGSSIFHTQPVICAPFNRLAYKVNNGPHKDWGDPIKWLSAGGNHVRADTIGDMLQVIYRDFIITRGRMS